MWIKAVLTAAALAVGLGGSMAAPAACTTSTITAVAPASADGYTAMLQAKNDMTWSGSDQMTSLRLPSGRVYWFAGDTMLSNGEAADGSYPAGSTMIGNRILLQAGDQLVNAMANNGMGIPNPATRTTANNERYWALNGIWANGFLYVSAARVKNDDAGGFVGVGTDLAKYTVDPLSGRLTLRAMVTTPSTAVQTGPGAAHIQWGADMIAAADGYTYVYGSTNAENNPYVLNYSYVARVPTSQIELASAWRFWKKTTGTWVQTVGALSQDNVNQPDAILGSGVSDAAVIGGKWTLVHKPWNAWGSEVLMETSASPTGPSTSRKLFDSPSGTWEGRNYQTYTPAMHPEATLASGKLLVSICWNGADFWQDTMKNADLAKPRFYEVTR